MVSVVREHSGVDYPEQDIHVRADVFVPRAWSATFYGPGETAAELSVGDFLLVDRGKYVGRLIRWGQALRFRGANRIYSRWNHAALVVSEQGDLVEALVRTGATRSHVDKYAGVTYVVVRTNCVPLDQSQILYFADRVVGEDYGFLNCLCVIVGYLTWNKWSFGVNGSIMCSGLVALSQTRAGAYFSRDASSIAPADLAKQYNVLLPRS
jgi:hypothetical protein